MGGGLDDGSQPESVASPVHPLEIFYHSSRDLIWLERAGEAKASCHLSIIPTREGSAAIARRSAAIGRFDPPGRAT